MAKKIRRVQALRNGDIPCRGCHETKATRPHQLCWACWADPKIRKRVGPISQMALYGGMREEKSYKHRACRAPVEALPGSKEKIQAFMRRLMQGEQLYHAHDAKPNLD